MDTAAFTRERMTASAGYSQRDKPAWKRWMMKLLVLTFVTISLAPAAAQNQDSLAGADSTTLASPDSIPVDSAATPFLSQFELADSLLRDTTPARPAIKTPVLTSDTIAVFLLRRVETLATTLNELNEQLRQPIDTVLIRTEMMLINRELNVIRNYFRNADARRIDLRSLQSIQSILTEISTRLGRLEEDILVYNHHLIGYQTTLNKIEQDSLNRLLPTDPILRNTYLRQLNDLTQRYRRAREQLKEKLIELGLLQELLTRHSIEINDLELRTTNQIKLYRNQLFTPKHKPLLAVSLEDYPLEMPAIWSISLRTARDTFLYFVRYNWGIRIINILLILFFFFFAIFNLEKIRKNPNLSETVVLSPLAYYNENAAVSAVATGLTFAPFLYGTPPLIFVLVIWVTLFCLMTVLFYKRAFSGVFIFWVGLVVLFIINGFIMLQMMTSYYERWLLFLLNIAEAGLGFAMLKNEKISQLKPLNRASISRFVVWLFLIMNLLAAIFNLLGYYNLTLTLSYAGTLQIIYAITLWIFIEMLAELAYLYIEANKEGLKSFSSWLDYQDVQNRLRRILGIFAIFMWLATFARSLGILDIGYDTIMNILTEPRNIGSASFTYGSLLIFILVIYGSLLVSRTLAYIFGNHGALIASDKKNNLGSSMLLVRIGILSGGFLLALSAAGISLDKVAIVLGALGVGIGFGLQGLINNLVSGIILAFEKPIKIGDVIELGPFMGRVKEIGIRSSKIITYDGADVIIPNGDMLSQHLTNWTLSNQSRRIEVIVGIGYGSDIPTAREAIKAAIESQEMVMRYPLPNILVHNFNNSSIDFRVLFWTNRLDEWISTKSNVMGAIYEELNKAGIEIPFPKRDIFLRYPQGPENGRNNFPDEQQPDEMTQDPEEKEPKEKKD